MIILSSDELEILGYLKSWSGRFVSIIDICRSASGRQRFRENPNWARPLMSRLVDEKLAEVNERGHYRAIMEAKAGPAVIGDDYFPTADQAAPVVAESPQPSIPKHKRWISPHIATILNKSGKKFSK